eukprot:Gb_34106 [translate_table: standard]
MTHLVKNVRDIFGSNLGAIVCAHTSRTIGLYTFSVFNTQMRLYLGQGCHNGKGSSPRGKYLDATRGSDGGLLDHFPTEVKEGLGCCRELTAAEDALSLEELTRGLAGKHNDGLDVVEAALCGLKRMNSMMALEGSFKKQGYEQFSNHKLQRRG